MKPRATLIGGDAAVISLFVLLGLCSHEGVSLAGWARNAVPLTAAWLVIGGALGVFRPEVASSLTTTLQRTALAWPLAAVVGLGARYFVLGHGLAVSFVVVTLLTNLVMLLVWRTAYAATRRAVRQEGSSS